MIGIIYSDAKSAVVLSVMWAIAAAGTVAACLFTPGRLDLALRLVGLGGWAVASYAASCALALKSVAAEIEQSEQGTRSPEDLGVRLNKLTHRALFGPVRGMLYNAYADTLVYSGRYKEAMIAASDAILHGKNGAKGEAAVRFCKIFYMLNDAEYFTIYYDRAEQTLRKKTESRDAAFCAAAHAQTVALKAMQLDLADDRAEALRCLRDFTPADVPPLYRKNLNALSDKIMAAAASESAEQ